MPFQYSPSESRAAFTIGDIIRERGAAQARAAEQRGAIEAQGAQQRGQAWAGAIQNIGQTVAAIPAQAQQAKQQADRAEIEGLQLESMKAQKAAALKAQAESAQLSALFAKGAPAAEDVYKVVGPERGLAIVKGMAALNVENQKAYDSAQTILRDTLQGMNALPEPMRIKAYPDVRGMLVQRGLVKPEDVPEEYNAAWFTQALAYGQKPEKPAEPFTLGEGQARFGPDGKQLASVPKTGAAPKAGTFEDYVQRYAAEKGLVESNDTGQGNIPLYGRPRVKNADGSISTVRSMSFNEGGKEILVPTVSPDGRIWSDKEAIEAYHKTGQHLGIFKTPEDATKYAELLHGDYAAGKYDKRPMGTADVEDARKRYQQADDRPRVDVHLPGAAGGLDPDAVGYLATQYRVLGPGGIPTRIEAADRVKVVNEAAKQAKALGQSPAQAVQKQAAFKADASSLTKIQAMASSAEAFETKAIAQADLVGQLSSKVSRTQWPLVNGMLLSGKAAVGNTDAHLFANALLTFTTEYAKLMEGSTGSAAGSSEGARRDAAKLISTALNKGTIDKTIDQMKWEMRQTRQGYDATINHITERMGGGQTQTPQSAVQPTGRYNPATGKVEPIGAK